MEIKSIFKEEFKFLIEKFEFHLKKGIQNKDYYEIIYLNSTTGVQIKYEYKESYIFIMLYKLDSGKLRMNPFNINQDTVLFGFSLDDILYLRNSESIIKPSYEYEEKSIFFNEKNGFKLYVSCFAKNLNEYAKDILMGDFSIFDKLNQLVKNRI